MKNWATIHPHKLSIAYPLLPRRPSPGSFVSSSFINVSCRASFKRFCVESEDTQKASPQGFSVFGPESDVPWANGTVWTTLSFYVFSLHIPLSFGGLSVVAYVSQRHVLDIQTQAVSLLGIQLVELFAAVCLLQSTAKPQLELMRIFQANKLAVGRSPLLGSLLGFGFLVLLVFLSSFLADISIGPKSINNSVLKEILLSSNLSRAACLLAYCVIIPVLEELIYRGFLLRSISKTMKWQQAVLLSSAIFSAIHFSGENSLLLFIIGCILGCCYCWTGDLKSPVFVHSMYNAMILFVTYVS